MSSENNYDWFKFYIDGQQKEQVSGTDNEWTRRAFYVPQGTHTFKFSYEKDGSVSSGSDCAWIDNLHLPLSGTNYIYLLDSICQGSEYQFRDSLISTEGFDAGIHHFVDSSETAVYSLTLVLTPTPQITITGGDVTIRKGETVRLTAEGAETYIWSSGETSSIIDVYPTETTTYTVTGYNGACSSTASTTITVEGTIGSVGSTVVFGSEDTLVGTNQKVTLGDFVKTRVSVDIAVLHVLDNTGTRAGGVGVVEDHHVGFGFIAVAEGDEQHVVAAARIEAH